MPTMGRNIGWRFGNGLDIQFGTNRIIGIDGHHMEAALIHRLMHRGYSRIHQLISH